MGKMLLKNEVFDRWYPAFFMKEEYGIGHNMVSGIGHWDTFE